MTDRKAEKARLRRAARALRRRIQPAERMRAAEALTGYAASIRGLAGGGTVSVFSTFGDELDTAPLVAALVRAGARLALPVVAAKAQPLVFRPWRPGDEMKSGPFGIAEPLDAAGEVDPAIFLVPLLAFDRRGYRVGYGGGFYDRTLQAARARRKVLALGLAFAAQEVPSVPTDEFDQPLDGVLTERGAIRCEGGMRAASLPW